MLVYKTTHKISGLFNNIIKNITNNTYYDNVVYYISKTGTYLNNNVNGIVHGVVNNECNTKNTTNNIQYEPVMLVRTRSNSIFSNSSNDDAGDCEYDVMSIINSDNLAEHLKYYEKQEHDEWMRYGILPSPKNFDTLSEYLCTLCGKEDQNALHYNYFSGCTHQCEKNGFNICCLCKFKFDLVIKKRAEPIWDLLDNKSVPYFWAPRTRRDPVTNQRIYSGPFTYEKWFALSNYVSYMTDSTKGYPGVENTPFIFCSLENIYEPSVSKLISVIDILKSNYNACSTGLYDTTYDPNVDDPINTLEIPPDAKIILRY